MSESIVRANYNVVANAPTQLDRVEAKLDRVIGLVDKVGALIDKYEPEITPLIAKGDAMLDKLRSHPMLKAFLR